jgi:hypothetical protein
VLKKFIPDDHRTATSASTPSPGAGAGGGGGSYVGVLRDPRDKPQKSLVFTPEQLAQYVPEHRYIPKIRSQTT